MDNRVSSCFTDNQIGPLYDDNLKKKIVMKKLRLFYGLREKDCWITYGHEKCSVAGEFQCFTFVVCLF